MIKSLVLSLSLVAGMALAFPASAAVFDHSATVDLLQPAPAGHDGCSVPFAAADVIFVEATDGCDLVMAELTGLCLVPASAEVGLLAMSQPPGTTPASCIPIRASPD